MLSKLLSFEGFAAAMFLLFAFLMISDNIKEHGQEAYKAECIKQGKAYYVAYEGKNREEGCR